MGTHGEGTIVARQGIGVSTKHPAAIDAASAAAATDGAESL